MNLTRKSLIGTFALVATLSTPLAFAQSDTSTDTSTDASTQSATPTDSSMQSTTPTDTSAQPTTTNEATTSNDAAAATTAGDPAKKSWADVDLDKDGNLSKTEAASVPALSQVFDKADSNADGSLTADEYKAYVAKSGDKGGKQY